MHKHNHMRLQTGLETFYAISETRSIAHRACTGYKC